MYRIRTINSIARKGLERFPAQRFAVSAEHEEPHGIVLRSHQLAEDELGSALLAVGRAGAGVNNIPVTECTARGIVVFNTPGANANAVKEMVLAMLLLGGRDVLGGIRFADSLDAAQPQAELRRLVEAEKKRFKGHELGGRTLGVLGLGAIGSQVANAALDLGMQVLGFDPALSVEAAWRIRREVQRMENVQALFARSDFVSLHVPLLESTHHFINEQTLRWFRPGATLLNFAREELVDAQALAAALDARHIGGYMCDFPARELLGREDVVATPHLGASTAEAEENCAVMVAEQVADFLQHGNIRGSVNFPSLALERVGSERIAFVNRNVPRILGQVLSILADRNANVIDMLNRSRDDIAYNLIDIDGTADQELLAAIGRVDGVIRAWHVVA